MTYKRDQIILAARDLIFEKGLQDVSMSQIAERAKVGMGTIYNYFNSKEELVYCLYDKTKTSISDFILKDYAEEQPIVVRFLYIFRKIIEYGVQYPREFRLSQQLEQVPFIQSQAQSKAYPSSIIFEQMFREAKNQRILKEMPDKIMVLLVVGALNSLVEAYTARQISIDDGLIEQAISACWDAIKR
jgi:TetR/AcrR family transcriptional regulator, repressor of fatR-cypB operon